MCLISAAVLQDTFQCAMLAVGSTIEMMENILKKNVRVVTILLTLF